MQIDPFFVLNVMRTMCSSEHLKAFISQERGCKKARASSDLNFYAAARRSPSNGFK
jgi:hypothetical protein